MNGSKLEDLQQMKSNLAMKNLLKHLEIFIQMNNF